MNKSDWATGMMKKMYRKKMQSLTKDKVTEYIICGETFEGDCIQCHKCKDCTHETCVDNDHLQPYGYCDMYKAKKCLGHC